MLPNSKVFVCAFHFERVFTWLSDVNECFSKAVALPINAYAKVCISCTFSDCKLCFVCVFSCKLAALAGWLAAWLVVNVSAAAVDPCSLVTLQILGLGSNRSIILTKFANFSSHGLSNRGTN